MTNKPALEGVTLTFTQDTDCCDMTGNGCQTLRVTTEDGGGGSYFVLETERWAIDPPEDLLDLLKEVERSIKKFNDDD
jgi:hypothetical protein